MDLVKIKYKAIVCVFLFHHQVLLELDEIFPAIQAAEMAVSLNPRCPHSLQTLGRAQIAIGEIQMVQYALMVHVGGGGGRGVTCYYILL